MSRRYVPSTMKPKTHDLPKGVRASDTKYPVRYKTAAHHPQLGHSFQLWYVEDWGWVSPTLEIAKRRYAHSLNGANRTYAVRLSDGDTVRVGNGPHVTQIVTVYLRKASMKRHQWIIDRITAGAMRANQIRDRISTRRLRSAMWNW